MPPYPPKTAGRPWELFTNRLRRAAGEAPSRRLPTLPLRPYGSITSAVKLASSLRIRVGGGRSNNALGTSVEIVMLSLDPLRDVHRTLDDGTKVWLAEAERSFP
jgi:hypothetical protein